MPLLHRKSFVPLKPPPDLRADEEVFVCRLTNEVFRDYDAFFERTIICSSLVWSCSMTGRSGLTYEEAVESEEKARRHLSTFPGYLQVPVLYLATLTRRGGLGDLCDDVFVFARDRFFIGEIVEVNHEGSRETCKVLKVIPPAPSGVPNGVSSSTKDGDVIVLDSDSDDCVILDGNDGKPTASSSAKCKPVPNPDPHLYKYQVVPVSGNGRAFQVPADFISRKKGLYTREKSKLFLKLHCEFVKEYWTVKPKFMRKYNLDERNFSEFFCGATPVFTTTPNKKIKRVKTTSTEKREKKKIREGVADQGGKKKKRKKEGKENLENKEKAGIRLTPEEKAALKDQVAQEKAAQRLAAKEQKAQERAVVREKMALERAEMKEKSRKEREEERIKMKLERDKEREKKKEERRAREERMKEWSKPREDLECDDLKELPMPVAVQTKVPNELFGDIIMIMDFLHIFSEILGTKEEFPDDGITLEYLESALVDLEIDGPLFELVKFLLTAIFKMQLEEEEDEKFDLNEQDVVAATDLTETLDEDMGRTYNAVTAAASVAAVWPQLHQGVPLRQLTLDPYTVSEVLRLHFLSSGAKTNSADAKYRYQQRGGYTPLDDAGLEFRMTESGILRTLSTGNLFDLSPGEKLKILSALCGHLMTFVTCRDYIEDSFEKWRTTRKEWRENQTAEQRRGKEEASARYKQRQEERAKEKERVKERKLKKQMLKEEMLRKDEQGKGQTNDKNNENGKLGKEKMEADEDDKPKRRLTRGMEKEEELEEKMEVDDNDGAGLAPEEEKERQKKLLEEEVKKRKEFHKKDRELFEQLQDMICKYNLTPLGQDRIYRRFWKFQSIPGLFVECDREYLDEDVLHPVEQTFKSNPFTPYSSSQESKEQVGEASSADKGEDCDTSTASNKENEENNLEMREENGESRDGKTILNESGSQNGSVKLNAVEAPKLENFDPCMLNFSHSQWSFYANTDDVDRLINTLNPRGYREGALKEALLLHKKGIMEGVQKCPIEKLRIPKTDHEAPSAVAAASTDVKPAKPKQVIVKLSGKKTGLVSEGHEDSSAGSETLELSLREQLLDLEERIYTGSLGCLKIEDRNAWIKAIENGSYDMQCRELTWGPWWARHKMDDKDTGAESMELGINEVSVGEHSLPQKQKDRVSELKRSETPTGSTRCSTPSTVDHVVKDLSCALLQIAQGIEPKYLKPPLGEDEATKKSKQKEAQEKAMKEFQAMVAQSKKGKKKDKKKQEQAEAEKGNENSDEESSSSDEESEPSKPEKTITERWQESLMSSSSIPQLFLHMATLDSSVMWSKSILHARCRICRRKGDAERMLLCDGCDRGHHMYCLKPPVKSIPSGDWYCVDCRPKIVKQNSRRRRKSTLEDYDSSNDEEEKEEADDDDESSRSEAESSSEDESEEEDSDDDDECNDDSDESAEASSDSDDESNNSEEDSHCDECAKCGREGQLILCETCPSAYHLKCANPPLKKIPAGKWICEVCTDKSQKKPTGIKFKGPAKSKSGKSTPSSVTGRSKKVSPEVKTGAEKRSRISARATGKEKPRSASLPRARTEGRTKRARDSGSSDSESPRGGSKRMKEGQPKKRFARKDSFSSEDSGPSSRRLPTSSSRGSEWSKQMKLCEQLINDVIRHKDAWPFLQPVSKKVVPDYYELIKQPMDLGSMKVKFRNLEYEGPAEVMADAKLLFSNCEIYNQPFSKEFKAGTRLKAFWEKKRKELGIDIRMKSKSMDGEKRQKRKSSVF